MEVLGAQISKIYLLDYFVQEERNDNRISQRIHEFLLSKGINSQILTCDTCVQLFFNLGWIARECNGSPIIIHFHGHANETGIGNNVRRGLNRISLDWDILRYYLSIINMRSNGRLILNMMNPCHGCSINNVVTDPPSYYHVFGTHEVQSRAVAEHCIQLYRLVISRINSFEEAFQYMNGLCDEIYHIH